MGPCLSCLPVSRVIPWCGIWAWEPACAGSSFPRVECLHLVSTAFPELLCLRLPSCSAAKITLPPTFPCLSAEPPKVLHYGLLWEVAGTGYKFDKHWHYDFDPLKCPPWQAVE